MATPPPNNKTPASPLGKIAAAILAASVAVAPFTMMSEGSVYKAYRDPVGIPTICEGHTKGVKMGDVASKAQCEIYLKEDLAEHMQLVLKDSPELIENNHALQAAGDFTFNAGNKGWPKSPMAAHFKKKEWAAGCNAFIGYYTGGTYPKPQPGLKCKPKFGAPGKYVCELKGLVTRRINESKICLGQPYK